MRSEQEEHSGGAQLSGCHGTSVTLTDNQLSHVWQTHRVASRRVAVPLAEGMQLLRRYFSNYTKIRKNRCTRTFWASAERCGEAIERAGVGWELGAGRGQRPFKRELYELCPKDDDSSRLALQAARPATHCRIASLHCTLRCAALCFCAAVRYSTVSNS